MTPAPATGRIARPAPGGGDRPRMLTPYAYPDMFTAEECARVVALAEAAVFREAGLVRGRRNASIRSAAIAWLDEEGEAAWVFERVVGAVLTANRAHFGFDLTAFAERVQVARYDAAVDGHFDWHADIGDGSFAAKRKLTLVAQLSCGAAYDGGALEVNANGRPDPAERALGGALLFPSFQLHRVSPVTRGRRYSLTTWVHGPEFQ